MKKVIVLNRKQAEVMTETDFGINRVIISISTVGDNAPNFHENHSIKQILCCFFNDLEANDKDKFPQTVFINEDVARGIANFAKEWWDKVDQIVVHCDGGVSRSAGVAAAILKYFTGDDGEICDNPNFYPNMLVYRMVLNALMESEE